MFCNKCGNQINQDEKFCGRCGTNLENTNISASTTNQQQNYVQDINNQYSSFNMTQQNTQMQYQSNYNGNQNQISKNSSWKSTTALVIGIISLILVFIFQIFTMPLSFAGIIFGILSVKNNKKHKAGLILNIISFVIAIPILLLYYSILNSGPANPTVGTWDCKAFNNGDNEHLDYVITMKLNNDDEFKWNKYNDEKNNYVIGTYEFVDLHKTNNNGSANYYSLKLTGEEFVSDGVVQTEPYKSEYEMGIINGTDEAILMNVYSYNMYYCHRNDTSVPKIK